MDALWFLSLIVQSRRKKLIEQKKSSWTFSCSFSWFPLLASPTHPTVRELREQTSLLELKTTVCRSGMNKQQHCTRTSVWRSPGWYPSWRASSWTSSRRSNSRTLRWRTWPSPSNGENHLSPSFKTSPVSSLPCLLDLTWNFWGNKSMKLVTFHVLIPRRPFPEIVCKTTSQSTCLPQGTTHFVQHNTSHTN